MAVNQILAFATAGGANVMAPSAYAALTARLTGYVSGIALSQQLNTTWRQSSVVAAMIGQFTADYSGQDVLDDGNVATLETNFRSALLTTSSLGIPYGVSTGTNSLGVTLSPAPTSWANLKIFLVRITNSNTGAATINPNGLGVRNIIQSDGATAITQDLLVAGSVAILLNDGANVQLLGCVNFGSGGSVPRGMAVLTSGSGTWTPPAGVTKVYVRLLGGGGSGGGSNATNAGASGGGAGGYAEGALDITPSGLAYVVGAGGNTGGGSANGNPGGTTSFGSASATGGGGGNTNGGVGGASGAGSFSGFLGLYGGGGNTVGGASGSGTGGPGGASAFGGGGLASPSGTAGSAAVAGSGGAGGFNLNAGGNGANGIIIITYS